MQLNWLMRYQPVVRLLDAMPPGTVLDVGSGWHGLSAFRAGLVVQTDLALSGARPSSPQAGSAVFLAASADHLPFSDGSFDYAVSLDLFEHLPDGTREQSVRELCRVARQAVLVGFPVGRPAEVVDRTLYRALRLGRRAVPDWLAEHRAQHVYPDRDLLARALPAGWSVARGVGSGNVASQTVLVLGEQLPGARGLTERLERRWRTKGVPHVLDRGPTYRTIFVVIPRPAA
jgi:SAM-dependent methyltransferase